ncbi:hypothetical protein Raf01_74820 [Rugosimonospora africana]|uniref:Uncharacterized protein n=1 Tax=Rugosimonospora africana TaxID=556532 RepID=A0A8J3R0V0_9ACTN|nr:hypothetical protein Raf01_74820 [Rugosimonospora africana]
MPQIRTVVWPGAKPTPVTVTVKPPRIDPSSGVTESMPTIGCGSTDFAKPAEAFAPPVVASAGAGPKLARPVNASVSNAVDDFRQK